MRSPSLLSLLPFRSLNRHLITTISNVGVAITGVVVARLLGALTLVVLARLMGVTDFGIYTTLYVLLGHVITISSLGLDTWLLRQGGDVTTLESTISQVFLVRLIVASILMSIAVFAFSAVGWVDLALPAILAALGLVCELLLTTAHSALRTQVRNYAAALLQIIVATLGLSFILLFWNAHLPLITATSYRLLAALVGVGMCIWLLRHSLRLIVWSPIQLLSIVKQAHAYFAADLLAAVALRADLTLVALLIGAVGAGIYNPALTIINTTFLVPAVAFQVLLPIVSNQPVGSRSFRWITRLAILGSLFYGLFWVIALGWGSELIVDFVFRAQYRDAVPLLQIMSFIPLLKSLNFCWAMVMVARDKQVLRTKLLAVASMINIVGNLICIPLFGLAGAAWVNVGTEIMLLLGYGYGAWISEFKHNENLAS